MANFQYIEYNPVEFLYEVEGWKMEVGSRKLEDIITINIYLTEQRAKQFKTARRIALNIIIKLNR